MSKKVQFILQTATLLVFAGLEILLFMKYDATVYVWILVVPVIPVFIVLFGYHTWRRICPLAFFSKISQNIKFKRRKIPKWFEENFFAFQFWFLFVAFILRATVLNSNTHFLAGFFILVIFLAFFTGILYSGKSWCNFLCPVSIVEKIYCVSGSYSYGAFQTSKCETCTACKKNCPDIDLENSHWREMGVNSRRFTVYAFPGLVFSFYFYNYLYAGSWDYYYSGLWAVEENLLYKINDPGFFFMPFIPKWAALVLTQLFFSFFGYYLFLYFEKMLQNSTSTKGFSQGDITHIVFTVAAFSAFNIYYIFAGAPSYSNFPAWYALFHFIVIVISTIVLWHEIHRKEKNFVQDRFAKQYLKKLKNEEPPTRDLQEIYYTYVLNEKQYNVRIQKYKETMKDLLSNGILDQDNIVMLEKMRDQTGIGSTEHNKIINELKIEDNELFTESSDFSVEKRLQINSYKKVLEKTLQNPNVSADVLKGIKDTYEIEDTTHKAIISELTDLDSVLNSKIKPIIDELVEKSKYVLQLQASSKYSIKYLRHLIRSDIVRSFNALKTTLALIADERIVNNLYSIINKDFDEETLHKTIGGVFNEDISRSVETLFQNIYKADKNTGETINYHKVLNNLLSSYKKNEYIVATSLYIAAEMKITFDFSFDTVRSYLIEDVINKLYENSSRQSNTTIIQRHIYLHNIKLFQTLDETELDSLAKAMEEVRFSKNETLVKSGDIGDSLYIIIEGSADIIITSKDGSDERISTVKEGDVIGEISVVCDIPRTASVVAGANLLTIKLSGNSFKNILYTNPELSLLVMQGITKRLLER